MSGRKVSPNIHDQATSGRDRKHWLDFGIALLLLATAAGTVLLLGIRSDSG